MKRLWQRISFTLVEMLAVVVIIGMLVVAGIPAFMRIASSGSLNSSLRQVSNALALARQYAITQRTTTRVIFPSKSTTDLSNGQGWTNMAYVSFAVILSNRTPAAGTGPWTYISKWEYLPMGSVFFRDSRPQPQWAKLEYLAFDSNVPTNSGGLSGITMNYIEFQPTGAASTMCTNPLIVREGFVNNSVIGGGPPTYTQSGPGGTNTPNNVGTITVDTMIGHIKVTRK